MSRFAGAVLTASLVLFSAVLAPPLMAPPAAAAPAAASDAQQALALLNAYRKSKGLGAVKLDARLSKMAQDLANACVAAKGKCDHTTGGSFAARLRKAGVNAGYGAENLRKNDTTIEGAFAWWKSSKIHNSNMLISQVTLLGFARAPATGKGFWVLIVTDSPN